MYLISSDLAVNIPYSGLDRQLSSTQWLCKSFSHTLSTIEHLYIDDQYSEIHREEDVIENSNTLWLQLLLPFTGVKNLHVSGEFGPGIVAVLLRGGRTEVLPDLQHMSMHLGPQPIETVSGKIVSSSLPRDGFPVNLSLFLTGSGTRERRKMKVHFHVCTPTYHLLILDVKLTWRCALRGRIAPKIGENFLGHGLAFADLSSISVRKLSPQECQGPASYVLDRRDVRSFTCAFVT